MVMVIWNEFCRFVVKVTIGEGVTSIGRYAFYSSNFSRLTSISIPESLTEIGYDAFYYDNRNLTAVYISSIEAWCEISFETRASNPLNNAHNLYLNGELVTELAIPDGVTRIGNFAFTGCYSLTSITFPGSVTSIGDHAFAQCNGLSDIDCYAKELPTIHSEAFYDVDIDNITLHVPASAVEKYKATAPWYDFSDVVPIEPLATDIVIADSYPENEFIQEEDVWYSSITYIRNFKHTNW